MSKLEERLAQQLAFAASDVNGRWRYPEPIRELHFDWCCEHSKLKHHGAPKVYRAFCSACDATAGWPVYPFHDFRHGRDWRFDFCWVDAKVAVELDGGTFTGGRHVRPIGFEKDAEKLNAAALQGWTVLRFTQRQVTSGQALEQIQAALKRAL